MATSTSTTERTVRRLLLAAAFSPAGLFFALILLCALVVAAVVADPADSTGPSTATSATMPGVDPKVLEAYNKAVEVVTAAKPGCKGMKVEIIGGIAEIESSAIAGRQIAENGDVTPHIIGPAIGYADTDGGKWDGLSGEDRAVGGGQFLPSTWTAYGLDANGDGVADPHNIYDVFAGTANYICGDSPVDLSDEKQLRAAIYRYNHSQAYVEDVLAQIRKFEAATAAAGSGVRTAGGNATGLAKTIIDAASAWIGTPYAWGGGGPSGPTRGIRDGGTADAHGDYAKTGFDCSGLTQYAYARAGITLPRSSREQAKLGTPIPPSSGFAALQPGDMVFWAYIPNDRNTVHHVGIYLGNGQVLHAPQSGSTVQISPMWQNGYAGGVRVL